MDTKRLISAKLSAKVTAEGFLSAYWSFLQGEGYLSPILEAYQKKELLPGEAFTLCQKAALQHWFQQEQVKADKKVKEDQEREASAPKVIRRKKEEKEVEESELHSDKYTVVLMCKVYDRAGNCTIQVGTVETKSVVEELINGVVSTRVVKEISPAVWEVNLFNIAQRLADRRLVERADAVYASITNNVGKPITTLIQRDDAIARLLSHKKGPSVRRTGSTSSSLKFEMHVKNDTCHFSRG